MFSDSDALAFRGCWNIGVDICEIVAWCFSAAAKYSAEHGPFVNPKRTLNKVLQALEKDLLMHTAYKHSCRGSIVLPPAVLQGSRCFQSLDFLFYDIVVKPWAAKTANRANIGASAVPPKPPKPKQRVLPRFLAVGSNRQIRQNVSIYETIVNQLLLSDVFQNTEMFNTCSCRA